jgi:hypothetical protein
MEEDRVRTTQEIKRNLFTSTPIFGEKLGMHVNEQQGGEEEFRKLEIACRQLEETIHRITPITANLPESTNNTHSLEGQSSEDTVDLDEQRGGDFTPCGKGNRFGRSLDDIFNHSWRPTRKEVWIWVAKPMMVGAQEYPARPEEIRREGWRARRVFRVKQPPPLVRSYAATVREVGMARREDERTGGSNRRFREDRLWGGNTVSRDGGSQEKIFRREEQLKEQAFRERGRGAFTGARSGREEDFHWRKRPLEPHGEGGANRPQYEGNRSGGPGTFFPLTHDRGGVIQAGGMNEEEQILAEMSKGDPGRDRKQEMCASSAGNPPFCFRCKESGHLAAKCPSNLSLTMNLYGFGFPGQGCHCLKIPGVNKQPTKAENVGLIRIKSGNASVEKVDKELQHLIDKSW